MHFATQFPPAGEGKKESKNYLKTKNDLMDGSHTHTNTCTQNLLEITEHLAFIEEAR